MHHIIISRFITIQRFILFCRRLVTRVVVEERPLNKWLFIVSLHRVLSVTINLFISLSCCVNWLRPVFLMFLCDMTSWPQWTESLKRAGLTITGEWFQLSVGFSVMLLRGWLAVTTGYSTERWEEHTVDDPRAITLDLRHRRGTGSLGDLDRALYDPNIVSCCLNKLVTTHADGSRWGGG